MPGSAFVVAFLFLLLSLTPITPLSANQSSAPYDDFNLSLSSEIKDAVDNGVSLTFICSFAMVQRFLFVTWPRKTKQHRFVVSYHGLSNRYVVRQDNLLTPHLFRSITQANDFMVEQSLRLFNTYISQNYDYQMRMSLSKYELPGPMRLNAFITKAWDLDTGWIKWTPES